MAIKTFKAVTPTLRHTRLEDRRELSTAKPSKKLSACKRKTGGRNNQGRITVRHRGGGVKRRLRKIDHSKDKYDIPGIVDGIEFDPNRSANIALIKYSDGEKRYVLAARGMKVGQTVISGEQGEPDVGNTMMLKYIPSGTAVHDVEMVRGRGGQLGRSAGAAIYIQGEDATGKYVQLKMPSGEIRLVPSDCRGTVGQVGNEDHMNVKLGKAGRSRRLGRRPAVRGVVMTPGQHPHGGGEGKGGIGGGRLSAKDLWGTRIGTRTRKNKKTDRFIVKRRKSVRRPFSKI